MSAEGGQRHALAGLWFDGRTSRPRAVRVGLAPGPRGPSLTLTPQEGGEPLALAHAQVQWPESWNPRRPPRKVVVDLGPHGSLEVDDVPAWHDAVARAGRRAPIAQHMQTRWTVFVAVLLVAAAALWSFYRWGTPWAAAVVTRHVPLAWELDLSLRGLRDLDDAFLKPSRLPRARQQELRSRFDALAAQVTPELRRYTGYAPALSLHFRDGLGANAFALPGGTIVLTDGMVEAAAKHGLPDDALLGVLAHEIGHVLHRHTTRMVVEQGVLNVGLGLALGDVSTVVSMGASLLTGLAYRRSHETEADCFAVALMRRANLPTAPMGDLLLRVEADMDPAAKASEPRKPAKDAEGAPWWNLLSSHPDTPQRARGLKAGHAPSRG